MRRFTLSLPNHHKKDTQESCIGEQVKLPNLLLDPEFDDTEQKDTEASLMEIDEKLVQMMRKDQDDTVQKQGESATSTSLNEPVVHEKPQLGYTKIIEILAEIFGFVPTQILDSIINAMNALIYEALTEVEKYLQEQLGQGPESEKIMDELTTLFENALDKNFDKFELFALKNIFNVPSEVQLRLPHYPKVNHQVSDNSLNELDKEIEHLKRKILAKKYYQVRLKRNVNEIQERNSLLSTVKPLLDNILTASPNSIVNDHDIQNLEHVFQNLKHLSQLQATAENRIQQLSFQSIISRADERSHYIAQKITGFLQQSKKKLLGENGLLESNQMEIPSMKVSEWSHQYNQAMSIGSVHDLNALNGMLT